MAISFLIACVPLPFETIIPGRWQPCRPATQRSLQKYLLGANVITPVIISSLHPSLQWIRTPP